MNDPQPMNTISDKRRWLVNELIEEQLNDYGSAIAPTVVATIEASVASLSDSEVFIIADDRGYTYPSVKRSFIERLLSL